MKVGDFRLSLIPDHNDISVLRQVRADGGHLQIAIFIDCNSQ